MENDVNQIEAIFYKQVRQLTAKACGRPIIERSFDIQFSDRWL